MAQGFNRGTTHLFECIVGINAGEHLAIDGSYRGEYRDEKGFDNEKWLHVLSMEMRLYL
jgi:hypothetical protein